MQTRLSSFAGLGAMGSPTHLPVREDWLSLRQEQALMSDVPVVDAHHHLYVRPDITYLLDDFLQDTRGGHHIRASVFVQARSMLPQNVHPSFQPIGETEFANGVAAMSASGIFGQTRVCAGIVGQADLCLGDAVRPILERHIAVAGGSDIGSGRFRGIRQPIAWDPNSLLVNPAYAVAPDVLDSTAFRAGFAHLEPLGLSFDAWLFFHQIPGLTRLARAFPQTPMVVNHCGGIVRIVEYAERAQQVYAQWRLGLEELARCPNVSIKLSGLGMRLGGFGFENQPLPPSSEELAQAWRPWVETCIELFGASRCMFGSNFPVDKGSYQYTTGLNAIKRIVEKASTDEQADILWRTASRFYRLDAALF